MKKYRTKLNQSSSLIAKYHAKNPTSTNVSSNKTFIWMTLYEKILQIAMSEINGQVPSVLFKAESTVLSVLSMIDDVFKGKYS